MREPSILSSMRSRVLIIIVVSQFACISMWFAGNSIIDDLVRDYGLSLKALGHLVSMVQFGFISGTLTFAWYAIADRFSPSKVFLFSALAAAFSNVGLVYSDGNASIIYLSRFLTGFFLAGIYPVGMKIAADYFDKDLSKALGYLVGALVLGTAFPHFLNHFQTSWPWKYVIIATSVLTISGGILVYAFIPDGPYRVKGASFYWKGLVRIFKDKVFRSTAFGYFGHMWELYAFWTFVPLILSSVKELHGVADQGYSLQSFIIIGVGGLACVLGGYMAKSLGSFKVAFMALCASGICCLISPVIFLLAPSFVFAFLFFWGIVVIMDSPQFSTLVAGSVPVENKGSALTLVNCIGFSITIVSIQVLTAFMVVIPAAYLFLLLLPGPVFGIVTMYKKG